MNIHTKIIFCWNKCPHQLHNGHEPQNVNIISTNHVTKELPTIHMH